MEVHENPIVTPNEKMWEDREKRIHEKDIYKAIRSALISVGVHGGKLIIIRPGNEMLFDEMLEHIRKTYKLTENTQHKMILQDGIEILIL